MGKNISGFTNEQFPQCGTLSGDLLDQKSKSPLFPGGVGAVVTNDWSIMQCIRGGSAVAHTLVSGSIKIRFFLRFLKRSTSS